MTCPTGKVQHTTAVKAWREVQKICKYNHTHQSRAYRCPTCGQYHLTSSMRDFGHETMRKAKWGMAA